jgi:membrane protease YdiL (CAAX protease family)
MSSRKSAAIALAIVIPAPSIGALVSFWLAPGPIGLAVYAICKAVLYLTPALWSRFVDGERWAVAGWSRKGMGTALGFALAVGAVIVLTRVLLGDAAIDINAFHSVLEQNGLSTPAKFVFAALWLSVINSLLEEYVFRWFITSRFERLTSRHATWLSGVAFTIHHIIVLAKYLPPATTALASAGIFIGGLVWSAIYRRAGSVWPSWLSHAIVDLAIMGVGYAALFRA